MMTIHQRIKDGIELHRRLTGDAPDMVVLSESARKTFLDEGTRPYSLASAVPTTVPSGQIGAVDGVPIRALPDMPGDYVGVVNGV